jgi:hypothetical protein
MFGKIKRQSPISQVTDIELWGWVESQNPVPLANSKNTGKWMFTPSRLALIDPLAMLLLQYHPSITLCFFYNSFGKWLMCG